jgi:single-stranded DNA-binding protein
LLEVEVLEAPQVRYTQDNQTPVAEMTVRFDGLRPEDPPGQLKVVGWGSLAQDLQNRVQVGQRLVLEGRLRMNTVTRQQDGVKEKRAEFTLARLHPLGAIGSAAQVAAGPAGPATGATPRRAPSSPPVRTTSSPVAANAANAASTAGPAATVWNSGPLVEQDLPDDDEIPF